MGIFDMLGSVFGDRKDTTTSGQQSGQSTNTGYANVWNLPGVQSYFGNLLNQFGQTPQFNQYQLGAANSQAGAGANLNPGFSAASTIAGQGINPSSISAFMSPYTQSVVDATQKQFDTQNALQNAQNSAYAAKAGALTGTGAQNLRAQTQLAQQTAQAPVIAGLYNQGYNNAANLAGQSAGLQLQGANTLGGLTGALTGANTAGFGFGNTLFQTPYNLASQGASTIAGFGGLGGQTQQGAFSGQQTGTQNTTAYNPGGIFGGLLGGAIKGLPMLFADGGQVPSRSSMPVHPKLERMLGKLEPVLHTMKRALRNGGEVKGYDDGGWVTTVTPEPTPSFTDKLSNAFDAFGQGYRQFNPSPQQQGQPQQPQGSSGDLLSQRMQDLAQGLRNIRGYDDGGTVDSGSNLLGSVRDYFADPKRQQLGSYLASMHGSPFASSEANALAQRQADLEAARMLGSLNGQPTLEARRLAQEGQLATGALNGVPTIAAKQYELSAAKNPAQIKALEAQSAEEQIRIKAIEQANALYQQRLKSIDDMESLELTPGTNRAFYEQQRANLAASHQAELDRLSSGGASRPTAPPSGVRMWNPNLPNGGL